MFLPRQGYVLIQDRGYCTLANGKFPKFCEANDSKTPNECEADCTSLESCVGYDTNTEDSTCALFPANSNCPSDYEFHGDNFFGGGDFAYTPSDLIGKPGDPSYHNSSHCYGKINGKNIKHLVQLLYISYYRHHKAVEAKQ